MKNDHVARRIPAHARVASAALLLAFLCGCGTLLVNVPRIEDDQAAYLVKGALGQTEAQREIAQRIVADEFDRRIKQVLLSDDSRNLPQWQALRDTLLNPVSIDPDRARQAPELREVKDRALVETYAKNNPDALSLKGADYSEPWKTKLAQAESKCNQLTAERKQLLKQADESMAAKDHPKAIEALAGAMAITPGDRALATRLSQAANEGWTLVRGDLQAKSLDRAPAILADPAVTTDRLDELEKGLVAQQDAVLGVVRAMTGLQADGQPLMTEDRRKEASALLQKSNDILAGIWENSASLRVGRSEFWPAYKYLAGRIESSQSRAALKHSKLGEKAKALFASNLVGGMSHFIDAASAAYERDQYGVSYIFCLMAEEMYDYAKAQQAPATAEAATRLEYARNVEKDAVQKIAALHDRRLIVLDFLPAVTEEGSQISYQERTLCNKKYGMPNSLAWRLAVPQGKTLTQNMVEPLDPSDTIISGEIKEITINQAPAREYDQQFVEVGSENIVEVVNPMFVNRIRDNQPKTIWQQEVAKFYRVKREHRKEGVLSLLLYSENPGQPSPPLLTLDVKFPSAELPLKELTMRCEEIAFADPIPGTPRTATLREDLKADPYPQSVPVQLSSDKEIQKAVLDFALANVDAAIENLVAQYPVQKLAEPALAARKGDDLATSAELWGQFLVYCRKLTEATLPEAEQQTISWTALRGIVEKNVAAWSASRWKERNAETLRGLGQFWNHSTADALASRVASP